jgi:hypothetical protein
MTYKIDNDCNYEEVHKLFNLRVRQVVPDFDISSGYQYWIKTHRKLTVKEKREIFEILHPEIRNGWDSDYKGQLIFSTLALMGFKDLDASPLVDRFSALCNFRNHEFDAERKFISNMLVEVVSECNFDALNKFFEIEGIESLYWQEFVLRRALKNKAFRQDYRFSWLKSDPRYKNITINAFSVSS